jgi:hypothetical protein
MSIKGDTVIFIKMKKIEKSKKMMYFCKKNEHKSPEVGEMDDLKSDFGTNG